MKELLMFLKVNETKHLELMTQNLTGVENRIQHYKEGDLPVHTDDRRYVLEALEKYTEQLRGEMDVDNKNEKIDDLVSKIKELRSTEDYEWWLKDLYVPQQFKRQFGWKIHDSLNKDIVQKFKLLVKSPPELRVEMIVEALKRKGDFNIVIAEDRVYGGSLVVLDKALIIHHFEVNNQPNTK